MEVGGVAAPRTRSVTKNFKTTIRLCIIIQSRLRLLVLLVGVRDRRFERGPKLSFQLDVLARRPQQHAPPRLHVRAVIGGRSDNHSDLIRSDHEVVVLLNSIRSTSAAVEAGALFSRLISNVASTSLHRSRKARFTCGARHS